MLRKVIDLRSDTVTRPSAGMLQAMLQAQVGDDVWGDDPSVLKLQTVLAEHCDKQAGLFFPSGTQSNLAALMAHCERGDEYIVGQLAHTYKYEGGGAAVLGSIVPQPIENAADGSLPIEKIAAVIKPHGPGLGAHFARTRLLALENTFNGQSLSLTYLREATTFAHSRGLATHLDGARVCNAAIAEGVSLAEICKGFDSISICFSKGLGAPVGSVLVGAQQFIDRAYRWRKVLGGGMRQSGVLAAACLYALEHHFERLEQDHANADRLAQGLKKIDFLQVSAHYTNMVFVKVLQEHCGPLEAALRTQGILAQIQPMTRLVTHLDVSTQEIDTVIAAITQFFQGLSHVTDD